MKRILLKAILYAILWAISLTIHRLFGGLGFDLYEFAVDMIIGFVMWFIFAAIFDRKKKAGTYNRHLK